MQEMQVWFLGWENPLEKEMAIHPSILAWEIPWTEELGGLTVHGVAKSQRWLNMHTHTHSDLTVVQSCCDPAANP